MNHHAVSRQRWQGQTLLRERSTTHSLSEVLPQRHNKQHKPTNLTRPTGLINIRQWMPASRSRSRFHLLHQHTQTTTGAAAVARNNELACYPLGRLCFLYDTLKGKVWRRRSLQTKQMIHLVWSLNDSAAETKLKQWEDSVLFAARYTFFHWQLCLCDVTWGHMPA